MDDNNKILSQNDIDSIFAQVPVEEPPPKAKVSSPQAAPKPAAVAVKNAESEEDIGTPSAMAKPSGASYKVAEINIASLDSAEKQIEVAPPAPTITAPPPAVAIAGGDAIGTIIADMSNRLARVESVVSKVEKLESAMDSLSQLEVVVARISSNHPKIKEFQNVVAHIRQLNSQVKGLNANLQSTLNYNLHQTFHCTCGSHGLVANRVKCTQCGREIWQGWWPKKR